MDLLSDVLHDLRLESVLMSIGEMRSPWGIDKGKVRGAAPFHVIVEGRCQLGIAGRPPLELAPGDLVVFPHGDPHALRSEPGTSLVPFGAVLEANGLQPTWAPGRRVDALDRIRFGGAGALMRMLNGLFVFRDRRSNPLLDSLPPLIHVRAQSAEKGPDGLRSSLRLLVDEAMSERPGSHALIQRLADIVFVGAVRDCIAAAPPDESGWLRGLADPQVARAIALVHQRPADPWTVASLAKEVAMSRTVLARRFRQLLGSSVMEYVTARRMHAAAGMLSESTQAMGDVANHVGYESEISFNKAFRRWAGVPPGRYRRQMRVSAQPS